MAGYYTFRKLVVEAHTHEVIVVGKPGVWSWDGLNLTAVAQKPSRGQNMDQEVENNNVGRTRAKAN